MEFDMRLPPENKFINFLASTLMYDGNNLKMDEIFPPMLYDSTGALMLSLGIEEQFGITVPLEIASKFKKPRDIYEYLLQR